MMFFLDQFHCTILLRRYRQQFHPPAGSFIQSVKHGNIRIMNIFAVLCALFGRSDKRSFHVDTVKTCPFRQKTFLRIGFRRLTDRKEHFFRKRHCCRHDIRYPYRRLIQRHFIDGLSCSVAEIMSHTTMKMNICQSRYRIAVRRIDLAFIRYFLHTVRKRIALNINIFCYKNPVFCINTGIFNNHTNRAPF